MKPLKIFWFRISVWEDEKILEMETGDSCTMMYVRPLTCALNDGKVHAVYILPQFKKSILGTLDKVTWRNFCIFF